jgi:hypothetical protein
VQKDKDTLKAAVLGTADYHTTMRQIVDDSLRRLVNYVPSHMNVDNSYNSLPPVHADYLPQVDLIMQKLAGDNELLDCNPRSPYLMLAWLLIGSDNEYRICQYIDDMCIAKQAAIIHIRIALGGTPVLRDIQDAFKVARQRSEDASSVSWSAIWAATRSALS